MRSDGSVRVKEGSEVGMLDARVQITRKSNKVSVQGGRWTDDHGGEKKTRLATR